MAGWDYTLLGEKPKQVKEVLHNAVVAIHGHGDLGTTQWGLVAEHLAKQLAQLQEEHDKFKCSVLNDISSICAITGGMLDTLKGLDCKTEEQQ